MTGTPVQSFADLVIAILERGVCLVIRLDGAPGERRLLCGLGVAEAASPLVMALCAAGALGTGQLDPFTEDFDDFGWE